MGTPAGDDRAGIAAGAGTTGSLSDAMLRLPVAYAEALRLEGEHTGRATMADRLGVPVESVEPLLVLARAKLCSLLAEAEDA